MAEEFTLIDPILLESIAEQYCNMLIKKLKQNGSVASGNLINNIYGQVIETHDGYSININAPEYLIYVDKGRARGTMPPVAPIEKWVNVKGIASGAEATSIAWAVAKKIEKRGIPSTNVISKTNDEFGLAEINTLITKNLNTNVSRYIMNLGQKLEN